MNAISRLKRNICIAAVALPILLVGVAGSILAAETEGVDGPKEKAAMTTAKISLSQAIETAGLQVGGKVTATGIENQDDTSIYYDITVTKAGVEQKVLIDMQTGKVVSITPEDKMAEIDKKD